jgi:ABC-2 type transport system ATP-binding protein
MAEYAISAEDLTYRYGNLTAVDRINFNVSQGEILGFLGPNGAGKTTTVKMLTGQMKPKGGRAVLLGMDVSRNIEKVQGYIGVCFETTNLYEQMSAIENLNLFARLFGTKSFDAVALLGRVGLKGRGKDLFQGYEAAPHGGQVAGEPAANPLPRRADRRARPHFLGGNPRGHP